jgi:thiamine kinase-like enzyme
VFKLNVNGQNKILRLHDSTKQLALYEKEEWCANAASRAGILTPKILATGLQDGWSYSFQEYIESAPADYIKTEQIWKTLGEYANKIHQIAAPNYEINYKDQLNNYNHFFLSKADYLLTQNIYNEIAKRLKEAEGWIFTPRLCHGNLHPSNVVVDESEDVWLIDWETATGNITPHADLAEIFTWNNGKYNIDLFCEGYGISRAELDSMMRDIQTLVLFRLLQVIQRKINRSLSDEWQQDTFIAETVTLFSSIDNWQQDILFTKNLE